MTDEITQQTLLPGVKDPNLWMVKCLPGTEKETLLKIMQKYISLEHSDDPNHEALQIRFAFQSIYQSFKKALLHLTDLSMHVSLPKAWPQVNIL